MRAPSIQTDALQPKQLMADHQLVGCFGIYTKVYYELGGSNIATET